MLPGGRRPYLLGLLAARIFLAGSFALASSQQADSNTNTIAKPSQVGQPTEYGQLIEEFPAAANLASNSQWLALLHFEVTPSGSIKHSFVKSETFFLSDDGKRNPASELYATLKAFNSNTGETDEHALCRFPARRMWLQANAGYTFNTPACKAFDDWAMLDTVDSISMVFATGHFASPASFFGHNFLKINRKNNTSHLLDTAINFGAQIPPNENPLVYLANGIFGGYQASYSAEPFYRFLAKYGEEDLRDVWEYKLAFNTLQEKILVAHTWELQDVSFPYYFFRQNCAFHISALLNVFTTQRYVPEYLPWAMPITVFDRMMSSKIGDVPLVSDIELHRSRRSLFQNRFAASSPELKRLIHKHSLGLLDLSKSDDFDALSTSDKTSFVDTMLDYSAFMAKEKGGAVHRENQRLLLLQRLSLPSGEANKPPADKTQPPHLGQRPGYAAIGFTSNKEGNNSGFLRIRPAYYDFLSIEAARKPHASFTLFDTQVKFDSGISIEKFDLFNISNLNTHYSGIAIDNALSWQLRLGYEPVSDRCNDCNAWGLNWDIGKSKNINNDLAVFFLGGISAAESRNRTANGALHAHLGITGKLHPKWRVHAKIAYTESFNRHQPFDFSYEVENRFGNSRWWDVRLSIQHRDATDVSLSMAYYW